MDSDEIKELLTSLTLSYGRLATRMISLEFICSKLVREVAALGLAPETRLMRIVAELEGTATAIAAAQPSGSEMYFPEQIVETVVRVCEMADGDGGR